MNNKIYTLTLNPAIDLVASFNGVMKDNSVNRTDEEDYQANGKGINISYILKQLNIESTALGFLAGFTGDFIEQSLKRDEILTDFIYVNGVTRINMFINCEKEYKILNRGPLLDIKSKNKIIDKIKKINEGDYLFVSGSNAKGLDDDIYLEISKICYKNKVKLILDISSEMLMNCLKYKPYLIKPNEEEIKKFIGKENIDENSILNFSKSCIEKGVSKIIVSLGDKGSIYMDKENCYKISALSGEIVNTACAGDTLIGAFIGKLLKGQNLINSLKFASCAASLTAFSKGLCNINEVKNYIEKIKIIDFKEMVK